jgi:uncharacterized protein Usg
MTPIPAPVPRRRASAEPGPRLATAQVLYYMPDHPSLLQSFVWQTQDTAPGFPRIARFLDHWRRDIEAVIHSVEISARTLSYRSSVRRADFDGRLH